MQKSTPIYLLAFLCFGIQPAVAQEVYPLWEGRAKPYYKDNQLQEHEEEMWGSVAVLDVTEPTLTVYPAEGENRGTAVVIMPGGGYEVVAMHHEGYEVAERLAARGITAAVLKYRIPNPASSDQPHLVPLTDARRALKLLRGMADTYGIDPAKVGVLGFSAGSHLATVVSLWESEDEAENPDFAALIYGVTDFSGSNLQWLEANLYHRKMSEAEVAQNQLLTLVSERTPPTFLVHAVDDEMCRVTETTLYAEQLHKYKVLSEVHVFAKGGHGFGAGSKADGTDQWIGLLANWLAVNGL